MKAPNQTFVAMPLRRGRGRLLNVQAQGHDPVLLEALGRALHWQALLDEGAVASNAEIAEREGLERSTVTRLLPLALLAPAIIEQCLAGRQPRSLTLRWLQRHRLPDDWQGQHRAIDRFE
jgi:ParB-like chromosome segregation protein Spo0J